MNFSQMTREIGIRYGALHRLLNREIGEESLGFIVAEGGVYLGTDEHSFKHEEMVYTITEVKQKEC